MAIFRRLEQMAAFHGLVASSGSSSHALDSCIA